MIEIYDEFPQDSRGVPLWFIHGLLVCWRAPVVGLFNLSTLCGKRLQHQLRGIVLACAPGSILTLKALGPAFVSSSMVV